MMKFIKYLFLIILLILLLVVGLLAYLTMTESGMNQILTVSKNYAPGTLEYQKAKGNLLNSFDLYDVHYQQDDGLDFKAKHVNLDWKLPISLSQILQINSLKLEGADIHLPAPAAVEKPVEKTPVELPEVSLPLGVKITAIALKDVHIYPYQQENAIEINSLLLQAEMKGSSVVIESLSVDSSDVLLTLKAETSTQGNYPLSAHLKWEFNSDKIGAVHGHGFMEGDLSELILTHSVQGPADVELKAQLFDLLNNPQWDAELQVDSESLKALDPSLINTPLNAKINSKGAIEQFSAQASIQSGHDQTGPVDLQLALNGSPDKIFFENIQLLLSESGSIVALDGFFDVKGSAVDVNGDWKDLRWPLKSEPQFESASGQLKLVGPLDQFKINLSTEVDGRDIPQGDWSFEGTGDQDHLNAFTLQGETLDGIIGVKGDARWKPNVQWQSVLSTEGINPAVQWEQAKGRINLQLTNNGEIINGEVKAKASLARLDGSFRGQALKGKGNVEVEGKDVSIDAMDIHLGPNHVGLEGTAGEELGLDWVLKSTDLSTLDPSIEGVVDAKGAVKGSLDKLDVIAKAVLGKLSVGDINVKDLNADIDLNISGERQSKIDLSVDEVALADQLIKDINLKGHGLPQDHQLKLQLDSKPADLSLQLQGAYDESKKGWKGFLDQLSVKQTEFGDWVQSKPAKISSSANEAQIDPLCLESNASSLCLNGMWSKASGASAELEIGQLDLQRFKAFFPEGLALDTLVNGDASGSLNQDGVISAKSTVNLSPSTLSYKLDGDSAEFELEKVQLNASVKGNNAKATLDTVVTDLGFVKANADIKDFKDNPYLDVDLKSEFYNLTSISVFVPAIQEITGKLESDLQVKGRVDTPKIIGTLALNDFSAEVPEIALKLEETSFALLSDGENPLQLNAHALSGGGILDINGELDPQSRKLQLAIVGDDFQVANSQKLQARISPNINVAMDNAGMAVQGELVVPNAYINANGGNDSIDTLASSNDVVYVTDENPDLEEPEKQNINLDLNIVLGDDIRVEAGDFKGGLKGELKVTQTPELATSGAGTIEVINGDYVIYGQQLNMQRGKILFAGGPIDNPKLDLDVAREVPEHEVIAGAKIGGTAKAPQLQLYSDPSMPDASILSYILVGQPPGVAGGSYTVGKYLTPDLYVSYGIGLFNVANTFNMKYKLTDKFSLQAASSTSSSADLVYTFEK